MQYILDTIDLYLASIAFWSLAAYFIFPIVLNIAFPIPWNIEVHDRNPKHWSAFFIKKGRVISIVLSILYVASYMIAYQELFPQSYEFVILKNELSRIYMQCGALLIPAIFIEHTHYFGDLILPGINDKSTRT